MPTSVRRLFLTTIMECQMLLINNSELWTSRNVRLVDRIPGKLTVCHVMVSIMSCQGLNWGQSKNFTSAAPQFSDFGQAVPFLHHRVMWDTVNQVLTL